MSELQTVASKSDVSPGQCIAVDVGGQQVALFNVEGNFFAISGTCTHRGGPLADGQGRFDDGNLPLAQGQV